MSSLERIYLYESEKTVLDILQEARYEKGKEKFWYSVISNNRGEIKSVAFKIFLFVFQ